MRKFPVYSLLQTINMQLMIVILIVGYIAYDQIEFIGWVSYLIVGISGVAIILMMKNMIKSFAWAKVIEVKKVSFFKTFKRNLLIPMVSNLIIGVLTFIHFYIWYYQGKDLTHLYQEYGIGVILGIGLSILNLLDSNITTTDQGIAFGSKLQPQLIQWDQIAHASTTSKGLTITPKQKFGVRHVHISKQDINPFLLQILKSKGLFKRSL